MRRLHFYYFYSAIRTMLGEYTVCHGVNNL